MATVCQVPLVADGTRGGRCRNPDSSAAGFHLVAMNHRVSSFLTLLARQDIVNAASTCRLSPFSLLHGFPLCPCHQGPPAERSMLGAL